MLTDILEPRANELLALIRDDLQRAGLDKQIPAGFVLAGGARASTVSSNLPSRLSTCRCASPSRKASSICPSRLPSPNMQL